MMANPTITIAGVTREMTDEEYADFLQDQKVSQEIQKEREAKELAKQKARETALAKLIDLGLTEEEIAALQADG